jgi:hypothetical protein
MPRTTVSAPERLRPPRPRQDAAAFCPVCRTHLWPTEPCRARPSSRHEPSTQPAKLWGRRALSVRPTRGGHAAQPAPTDESIVWESVTAKTARRFRAIGKFLLGHELPQPLTWGAIEGTLPPLGAAKRYGTKLIRSCLIDIGHLLVERGLLERRADYVSRRRILQPLEKLPACFKPDLTR